MVMLIEIEIDEHEVDFVFVRSGLLRFIRATQELQPAYRGIQALVYAFHH